MHQVIDWNDPVFEWDQRARERGLRGIAFDGDTIYCAASDELYAFDTRFEIKASWRNPYLKHCRGIVAWERKLYIVSSGFDSIVGFDLDRQKFDWALQVLSRGFAVGAHPYDPTTDDGPIMLAKLDLRDIYCDASGMYITADPGLLRFSGNAINVAVELPAGSRNAQPYRDGILFNDSLDGSVRYAGRGEGEEDRTLKVPRPDDTRIQNRDWCDDELALAGFTRGLCRISDTVVAGGSSPSTVTVYDLAGNRILLSVQILADARSSVHGLEVWPFD